VPDPTQAFRGHANDRDVGASSVDTAAAGIVVFVDPTTHSSIALIGGLARSYIVGTCTVKW
jgi:hypothetical protein